MNKKYYKYLNTLFVVIPMTMIMATIGVSRTHEFDSEWIFKFFKAWSAMLPVAYVSAFLIIPNARKLAEKITKIN
ncbi:DUF2798 domain-containing protein [Myroides injenensis]|uniref:DUF2798 domain-containing protein n=1 Tax=Myroides injenensis TaxID=1183151 RepID=UPI0002887AB4|nr:DUF2798 domain-containing protein [Myroides injenensis]